MSAVSERLGAVPPPRGSGGPRLLVLEASECWELLRSQEVGRLVYTDAALPAVVPVAYAVVGDEIVVAATPGDKVATASRGSVVAFEVDSFDPGSRTGWSVTAVGPARLLSDPHLALQLRDKGLVPWAPAPVSHLLVITVGVLSGRRLARP